MVLRDLAAETVPHLSAERFAAFVSKPDERSAAQHDVVAYSDTLIGELKRADVIVLGLPMYNFGVPSQLKAYFDHIARAGRDLPLHRRRAGGAPDGEKGLCVRGPRGLVRRQRA